jgi:hypothetical protein
MPGQLCGTHIELRHRKISFIAVFFDDAYLQYGQGL